MTHWIMCILNNCWRQISWGEIWAYESFDKPNCEHHRYNSSQITSISVQGLEEGNVEFSHNAIILHPQVGR
jgi:hypothetical protein